jgi:hypothetical protein
MLGAFDRNRPVPHLRRRGCQIVSVIACATGLASMGCSNFTVELPPPAAPTQDVPDVGRNLGPAAPGRQWVVLDVPGDTATVTTVTGATVRGYEVMETLCVTPCVADLRPGPRTLLFTSTTKPDGTDRVEVQVPADPLVVRHIMEQRASVSGAGVGFGVLGTLGLLAGAITAPVGAAQRSSGNSSEGQTVEMAGLATLGASAGMIGLALVVGYLGRGTHTPGATTQWTIPRSGGPASSLVPVSGAPALVRF